MKTHCKSNRLQLQGPGRRDLVADFDGGTITSDGGAILLREVDRQRQIVRRFADCFVDARDRERIEHPVEDLLRQRIFALAAGYEDLNDHEQLRKDPLLATLVGKSDVTGENRVRGRDQGAALAGKSTLCRLEHALEAEAAESRYTRIAADSEAIESFFVDTFLDSFDEAPERLILDFDATDNPLHGEQEGRFFHGYYGHYCYLPLYVFCGRQILWAQLRRSNIDASEGSREVLQMLVGRLREQWPGVEIVLRADSGFARDALMDWCEQNEIDFVLGLARNARLQRLLEPSFEQLEAELEGSDVCTGRRYADLRYRTQKSWSRERRVIGKAEITSGGRNPRFVVTSLDIEQMGTGELYEDLYCARGDMENRIKEQQLDLFSTRTSCRQMPANQMRLWLSAVAYTLFEELRRLALEGTELAKARCETIRSKLLKIGARVRVSVRKIWVSLSSAYPYQKLFRQALARLQGHDPPIPV